MAASNGRAGGCIERHQHNEFLDDAGRIRRFESRVGVTCRSPAVVTAYDVLRSSKAQSVVLYIVECTIAGVFESHSMASHWSFLQRTLRRAWATPSEPSQLPHLPRWGRADPAVSF